MTRKHVTNSKIPHPLPFGCHKCMVAIALNLKITEEMFKYCVKEVLKYCALKKLKCGVKI